MSLLDAVVNFFKKSEQTAIDVPEGYCPNCWGRQEYSGKFYEAINNEQIDLNNVMEKKGWIQAYAAEHLEGIQLEEKEGDLECKSCKVSYKPVS